LRQPYTSSVSPSTTGCRATGKLSWPKWNSRCERKAFRPSRPRAHDREATRKPLA
jgi:hypothetical protein